MQIKRLRIFESHLRVEPDFQSLDLVLFYFYAGVWRNLEVSPAEKGLKHEGMDDELSQVLDENVPWRPKRAKYAYIPIKELDAVVFIRTTKALRKTTLKKLNATVRKCASNSRNHFDAFHNRKSGLLNQAGFEEEFGKITGWTHSDNEVAAGIDLPPSIAVIAIDIDHFKQVNDSYGHQYGDVVLHAVGQRLQATAAKIVEDHSELFVLLAHPSGEEFVVLLAGKLTIQTSYQLAEELRTAVSNKALPTEEEFQLCPERHPSLSLRPETERGIAVSVGVSNVHSLSDATLENPRFLLMSQADKALSFAKNCGRNMTMSYSEILSRGGRVLEHHESNIVAIDIGSSIGVREGQEFLVYHPDMSGTKPFRVDDGRTKRQLGLYPRLSVGRIVAVKVQSDITFCVVAENRTSVSFPRGASLDLIPLGSFSHLLGDKILLRSPLELGELDQQAFEQKAANSPDSFVIVLKLKNVDTLHQKYGNDFLNSALAGLYKSSRDWFRSGTVLTRTSSTEFALLYPPETRSQDVRQMIEAIFESASSDLQNRDIFCAGIYSRNHFKTSQEKFSDDRSELEPSAALYFARVACQVAEFGTNPIVWFERNTCRDFLLSVRSTASPDQLIRDYESFRSQGVKNGLIENDMAVAFWRADPRDVQRALECVQRAVELMPTSRVYLANFLYMQFYSGNRLVAIDTARTYFGHFGAESLTGAYLTAFVICCLDAAKAGMGIVPRLVAHELLKNAAQTKGPFSEQIESALQEFSKQQVPT